MHYDTTMKQLTAGKQRLALPASKQEEYQFMEQLIADVAHDLRMFRAVQQSTRTSYFEKFLDRFPHTNSAKSSYRSALDAVAGLEFTHARLYEFLPEQIRFYQENDAFIFHPGNSHDITDAFFQVQQDLFVERFERMKGIEADLFAAGCRYEAVAHKTMGRYAQLVNLNNKGDAGVRVLRLAFDNVGKTVANLGSAMKSDYAVFEKREERRKLYNASLRTNASPK